MQRGLLILLCVFSVACGPPGPTSRRVTPQDLYGSYTYWKRNGGERIVLTLYADGTYLQRLDIGPTPIERRGTWTLDGTDLDLSGLWISRATDDAQPDDSLSRVVWWVVDSYHKEGKFALFGGDTYDPDSGVVIDKIESR